MDTNMETETHKFIHKLCTTKYTKNTLTESPVMQNTNHSFTLNIKDTSNSCSETSKAAPMTIPHHSTETYSQVLHTILNSTHWLGRDCSIVADVKPELVQLTVNFIRFWESYLLYAIPQLQWFKKAGGHLLSLAPPHTTQHSITSNNLVSICEKTVTLQFGLILTILKNNILYMCLPSRKDT